MFSSVCASERVGDGINPDKHADDEIVALMRLLSPEGEHEVANPRTDIVSLVTYYERVVDSRRLSELPYSDSRSRGVRRLASILYGKLDAMDFASLERMFRRGSVEARQSRLLESYYSKRWIAKEVAAVCADPRLKPTFPPESYTPTREELNMARFSVGLTATPSSSASRYLARLWSVALASRKAAIPTEVLAQRRMGEDDFRRAIEDFPYEQPKVTSGDVSAFRGRIGIFGEREMLQLKCLIRERKIAEAVVASLGVWSDGYEQWKVELLTFAGLDWEEAMLAARDFRFLAAAGSAKGALLAIEDFERDESVMSRFQTLASFLMSGPDGDWAKDDRRRRLSVEVQSVIFAEFDKAMKLDSPMSEVNEALAAAESLLRTEIRPSLRRLLAYPSSHVARRAAAILQQLGDDVPEIARQPDASFVLKMNGKVWAGADVCWEIVGMGRPQFAKTGAEGDITIPRDELVDPAVAGKSLRFSLAKVTRPQMEKDGSFGAAWIEAKLPIPAVGDAPTVVELSVVPLPFRVTLSSVPTSPVVVSLVGEDPFFNSPKLSIQPTESTAQKSAAIKWVSPGKYRLHATSQGFSKTMTDFFEVKEGMEPISISLTKGVGVVCKIGARNVNHLNTIRLFANGRDVSEIYDPILNDDSGVVRIEGLPTGDFQLRVLSNEDRLRSIGFTEARIARELQSGWPIGLGTVRDFRIGDGGDDVIDLGVVEIRVSEPKWPDTPIDPK